MFTFIRVYVSTCVGYIVGIPYIVTLPLTDVHMYKRTHLNTYKRTHLNTLTINISKHIIHRSQNAEHVGYGVAFAYVG